MAESLKYFPLPMYHLTNLIKPKMTTVELQYQFTLLQTRILNEAKATPNNTASSYTVYQPSLTRLEANYILGTLDTSIASFSFDGADANKIVLASRFDGNGVRWDYCIDGHPTEGLSHWNEVSFDGSEEHKWLLTPEEVASITAENDIYIHIVGVNYNEENLYKIDIQESAGLPRTLYANDLENKVLGAVDSVQWKYEETDAWKYYKDSVPELKGNKTLILRRGATGTHLASNTSTTYTFTEDTDTEKRKYIPISHLKVKGCSSEAVNNGGSVRYAIDANLNTRWHSAWDGSDTQRYIIVELDKLSYISAVEYVPAGWGNGPAAPWAPASSRRSWAGNQRFPCPGRAAVPWPACPGGPRCTGWPPRPCPGSTPCRSCPWSPPGGAAGRRSPGRGGPWCRRWPRPRGG